MLMYMQSPGSISIKIVTFLNSRAQKELRDRTHDFDVIERRDGHWL